MFYEKKIKKPQKKLVYIFNSPLKIHHIG